MSKATRYAITVWPGIKTQDGATINQPYVHHFITERPKVRRVHFKTWKAPGYPVLQATFNQAVSLETVKRHIYLSAPVQGVSKRVSVLVEADPDDRQAPRFIVAPGESMLLDSGEQEHKKVDDEAVKKEGMEARRNWLLKPSVELPLDSTVELKTEPGLVSAFGKEKGATERTVLTFDTFPELEFYGISCRSNDNKKLLITNENYQSIGKCNPLETVALNFSAPVLNSEVKNKIILMPDLAGGRKDYDPWANYSDYSSLHWSHKKGRTYNVWLPETLKAAQQYLISPKEGQIVNDEFGRELTRSPEMTFLTDHRKPNIERVYR